eukprot:364187-Chlamydomonas_euryale.AAC.5
MPGAGPGSDSCILSHHGTRVRKSRQNWVDTDSWHAAFGMQGSLALRDLNNAIELDDTYVQGYVHRGKLHRQMCK